MTNDNLWILLPEASYTKQAQVFETIFIISKTTTMRSENILSADILDLIFENRNKNYGAYMLRKHYNGRMAKALAVTFLLVTASLLATLVFKPAKAKEILIIDPIYIKLLPEVVAEKPKNQQPQLHPNNLLK